MDDHYPVRLSAAASGDLEDLAKQEPDKDAVCLFESAHCYGWNTFTGRVLGEKKAALEAFFGMRGQERGTAFLYRTLDLLRTAQDPKDGKLQLARYAYLLARLEPPRTSPAFGAYRMFADRMYRWALNKTDRAEADSHVRRSVRGMAHSSARLTTSRSQKFRLKRSRMTISTVLTRSCAK